jgi:hypothetical protein
VREACTRSSQFGCPLDQGEDGRTNGACYTALRLLSAKGILKSLGVGAYARADVKAIAPPKKKRETGGRQ